mmetsp:Transcript_24008/g.72305  ORF Transcript_24008/g.72305 Transcript_24008/m.72305 type:complete len:85 (+) Transcript_24008:2945-3199(+)
MPMDTALDKENSLSIIRDVSSAALANLCSPNAHCFEVVLVGRAQKPLLSEVIAVKLPLVQLAVDGSLFVACCPAAAMTYNTART